MVLWEPMSLLTLNVVSFLLGLSGQEVLSDPDALIVGTPTYNVFIAPQCSGYEGIGMITVLLLFVANLNHFTIPWVMTGGGPAGASDIWITQIYQIAFGRIRFGIASAYSVILFFAMIVLGYFYVRALTSNEDR